MQCGTAGAAEQLAPNRGAARGDRQGGACARPSARGRAEDGEGDRGDNQDLGLSSRSSAVVSNKEPDRRLGSIEFLFGRTPASRCSRAADRVERRDKPRDAGVEERDGGAGRDAARFSTRLSQTSAGEIRGRSARDGGARRAAQVVATPITEVGLAARHYVVEKEWPRPTRSRLFPGGEGRSRDVGCRRRRGESERVAASLLRGSVMPTTAA